MACNPIALPQACAPTFIETRQTKPCRLSHSLVSPHLALTHLHFHFSVVCIAGPRPNFYRQRGRAWLGRSAKPELADAYSSHIASFICLQARAPTFTAMKAHLAW